MIHSCPADVSSSTATFKTAGIYLDPFAPTSAIT